VGYRVRMAPEAGKWVAGLAAQVSSACSSRQARDAPRRVLGKIGFWVAQSGLEAAYQQQLAALARARRAVADVATSRKRLELQVGELERQGGEQADPGTGAGDASRRGAAERSQATRDVTGQLAELRRQYAEMRAKEERVAAAGRRLMAEVDAFRTGKEATKAAYMAAEEAAEAVRAQMSRHQELSRAGQGLFATDSPRVPAGLRSGMSSSAS
jgi:phage shock protein A